MLSDDEDKSQLAQEGDQDGGEQPEEGKAWSHAEWRKSAGYISMGPYWIKSGSGTKDRLRELADHFHGGSMTEAVITAVEAYYAAAFADRHQPS